MKLTKLLNAIRYLSVALQIVEKALLLKNADVGAEVLFKGIKFTVGNDTYEVVGVVKKIARK